MVTVDRNEIAKSYSQLSNDELFRLHSTGELTDLAYGILELELTARKLTVPPRPIKPLKIKNELHKKIVDHWNGRARLASAFWLLGVIGLHLLSFFINLVAARGHPIATVVCVIVWLSYYIFALVSIWRCAWNTVWKGWGYIARAYVISIPVLILGPFILWGVEVSILR